MVFHYNNDTIALGGGGGGGRGGGRRRGRIERKKIEIFVEGG